MHARFELAFLAVRVSAVIASRCMPGGPTTFNRFSTKRSQKLTLEAVGVRDGPADPQQHMQGVLKQPPQRCQYGQKRGSSMGGVIQPHPLRQLPVKTNADQLLVPVLSIAS